METILALICVLSLLAFVVGMIKPKAVLFGILPPKRKFVALIYLILCLLSAAIGGKLYPTPEEEKEERVAVIEEIQEDSIIQPSQEVVLVDSIVYVEPETPEPTQKPVGTLTDVQQAIISIVKQCWQEYKKAPNELKKSAVRARRGELIREALGGERKFIDWVCVVRRMETTSQGNAIFELKMENSTIIIGNYNTELLDIFSEVLIPQSSPLYDIISELKKGDRVMVSGIFFPSSNKDFIQESSLTERGSMEKPDFSVKFSAVTKI